MKSDLAFVFSAQDIDDLRTNDVIYFPLTTVAKKFLIEQGKNYLLIESFFPRSTKKVIFDLSEKLSFRFTKLKIKNLPALSFSLNNFLAKKMFYLACFDSVFKKIKPKKIYIGAEENSFKSKLASSFDAYSPIIMTVANKHGVNVSGGSKSSLFLKYAVQFAILPKFRSEPTLGISKKVIIFAANTYHVKNCLSLIVAILKDKELEPLVIGKLGNSKSSLIDNGVNCIDYKGFIDLANIPGYLFTKLFLMVAALFLIRKEKINFLGYDLWNLVKNRLISLFLTDLPDLYLHDAFYSKLLQTYNVSRFIYLTNASNIQVYIERNKAKHIDSVEIQHGITFGADSKHFSANKIIAWGKIPAAIINRSGIKRNEIVVGGWPAYIDYGKLATLRTSSPKASPKKTILFLAQDSDGIFLLNTTQTADQSYERLFKAISKLNFKYKLILRLHPRADTKLPFLIAKKFNISFELSGEETLKAAIGRSDLVISQTTSAALDTIIMNKPIIYFPSMAWGVKYLDRGNVNAVATSAEGLAMSIVSNDIYLRSKELRVRQEKFLIDYCNWGKASISDLLEIVKGKSL